MTFDLLDLTYFLKIVPVYRNVIDQSVIYFVWQIDVTATINFLLEKLSTYLKTDFI